MSAYQMTAPAPRSDNTDAAAWALVAVVVALVCAGAGWAIARQDAPSQADVATEVELAGRESAQRGQRFGYQDGARLGRREAQLTGRTQVLAARRQGTTEGYAEGYREGRSQAGDPDAFMTGGLGGAASNPLPGYEDVLRSGLFGGGDEPGYSSSAYDAYGYGSTATTPYVGSAASTSAGDDY